MNTQQSRLARFPTHILFLSISLAELDIFSLHFLFIFLNFIFEKRQQQKKKAKKEFINELEFVALIRHKRLRQRRLQRRRRRPV